MRNTSRLYYKGKIQGRKAAATSKTKFSTCSFSLRFLCDYGGPKTAARHARLLQDKLGRKTSPPMYLSYESRKTTPRSPFKDLALYCKASARMSQNVCGIVKETQPNILISKVY